MWISVDSHVGSLGRTCGVRTLFSASPQIRAPQPTWISVDDNSLGVSAPGCDLGRVVFHAGADQVNSSLGSLPPGCESEFASAHSNGRVKTDHGLHPVRFTLQ